MAEQPTDIRSILDPVGSPMAVKHAAWQAFHGAKSREEFVEQFDKIDLPREVKRELWFKKFPEALAEIKQQRPEPPRPPQMSEPPRPPEQRMSVGGALLRSLGPVGSLVSVLTDGGADVASQHAVQSLGGATATEAYEMAGESAKRTVESALGEPISETRRKLPGIAQTAEFLYGAGKAIPGLVDFMLTPMGAATAVTPVSGVAKALPPAIKAIPSAYFGAEMTQGALRAGAEAVKDPTAEKVGETAGAVAMALLPVRHASKEYKKGTALAKQIEAVQRQMRERLAQQIEEAKIQREYEEYEASESNVVYPTPFKSAQESAQTFVKEYPPMAKSAAESAKVFQSEPPLPPESATPRDAALREMEQAPPERDVRQRELEDTLGVLMEYQRLFDQAERRYAKSPQVPSTGVPEGVARAQAAREVLAEKLLDKRWEDIGNVERIAIDELITEGYGSKSSAYTEPPKPPEMRTKSKPAPTEPPVVAPPPPSAPRAEGPVRSGVVAPTPVAEPPRPPESMAGAEPPRPLPAPFRNEVGTYQPMGVEGDRVRYTFTNRKGHASEQVMPLVDYERLAKKGEVVAEGREIAESTEGSRPPVSRTYDEVQSDIDALEDRLSAEMGQERFSKMYYDSPDSPPNANDVLRAAGWEPMPKELQDLYRERDAIGRREDVVIDSEIDSRLSRVIPDPALRAELVKVVTRTDKPAALRSYGTADDIGSTANDILSFVMGRITKERAQDGVFGKVKAVSDSKSGESGIRLAMETATGYSRPSRESIQKAQEILDAVMEGNAPKYPGLSSRPQSSGLGGTERKSLAGAEPPRPPVTSSVQSVPSGGTEPPRPPIASEPPVRYNEGVIAEPVDSAVAPDVPSVQADLGSSAPKPASLAPTSEIRREPPVQQVDNAPKSRTEPPLPQGTPIPVDEKPTPAPKEGVLSAGETAAGVEYVGPWLQERIFRDLDGQRQRYELRRHDDGSWEVTGPDASTLGTFPTLESAQKYVSDIEVATEYARHKPSGLGRIRIGESSNTKPPSKTRGKRTPKASSEPPRPPESVASFAPPEVKQEFQSKAESLKADILRKAEEAKARVSSEPPRPPETTALSFNAIERENGGWLVSAIRDGKEVGSAIVTSLGNDNYELNEIRVGKDNRRQGVGTALYDEAARVVASGNGKLYTSPEMTDAGKALVDSLGSRLGNNERVAGAWRKQIKPNSSEPPKPPAPQKSVSASDLPTATRAMQGKAEELGLGKGILKRLISDVEASVQISGHDVETAVRSKVAELERTRTNYEGMESSLAVLDKQIEVLRAGLPYREPPKP